MISIEDVSFSHFLFSFVLLYLFLLFVWMQVRIVFKRDLGPLAEREAAGTGK